MSNDNKIELTVVTLKIPITRENGKVIEGIDVSAYPTVNSETLEIETWVDLPSKTQDVANYNRRQILYAEEDSTRDYIFKKIIKK